LLEALRYKSEGRGFYVVIGIFHSLIPPGRSMALRSIQLLTEMSKGKVKGKAIPLQAWRGPEGSRRLRVPDFKTICK
jgi:hypothetical protein